VFRHIRISQDWVLLTLVVLLAGFCLFAAAGQYWLPLILCLPFIVVTLMILKKLSDARWCTTCQQATQQVAKENRPEEKIYYHCSSCGQTINSGVNASWYD
jgi:ABC-type sugar transport system substrate-binding protein